MLNIVAFFADYWDGPSKEKGTKPYLHSRQQIMYRMAKQNKVLYVSRPFSIREVLRDILKRELRPAGLFKVKDNLWSYIPPKFLPRVYYFKRVERLLSGVRLRLLRRVLKKLDFDDVVLYIWHPRFCEMVGQFDEELICYHVYDEFTSYDNLTQDQIDRVSELEDTLCKRADFVFTAGSALFERKNKYHNAIMIPNGVDYELFSSAVHGQRMVFDDLIGIPKPILGYVGTLNAKVDLRLLEYLAVRHPEWSIVLVGPVLADQKFKFELTKIKEYKNIYFLGFKVMDLIPHYVREFDICLMCYRTDLWALYGYPLKMHEYLACGKPVVSSDIMVVREFEGIIKIARSYEEWEDFILESLCEKDPHLIEIRMKVAKDHSWDARVREITQVMEQGIKQKYQCKPVS